LFCGNEQHLVFFLKSKRNILFLLVTCKRKKLYSHFYLKCGMPSPAMFSNINNDENRLYLTNCVNCHCLSCIMRGPENQVLRMLLLPRINPFVSLWRLKMEKKIIKKKPTNIHNVSLSDKMLKRNCVYLAY
jgi:hypothetical protein